jgi:Protein of unknown function (DUF1552)
MQDRRMVPEMRRRTFLGGLGAAGATALLRPLLAHAQAGVAPQRLLFIHRPCGTSSLGNGRWWPTGGTTGWTASPLLSSFTDGKLASLQNNMVVLKGLTCPRNMNWLGDAHGGGYLGMMTPPVKDVGTLSWPQSASASPANKADGHSKSLMPSDQSIDQLLLTQVAALGGTPIPSVQLTASTESSDQTNDLHCLRVTSYAKGTNGSQPRPLWPEPSPAIAFKNYFGAGLMNLTPAQMMRAAAQNKSVLDFALGGATSLQSVVPKSQLPKVQAQLDAIRQLETSVAATATGTCTAPSFAGGPFQPSAPMFSGGSGQGGVTNVGKLDQETYPMWEQHKEIIKTLFMCDLTRVISFTFGYGNSGIHFQNGVLDDPALAGKYKDPSGNAINNPDGHHDISHLVGGGDAVAAHYIIDKYYCDRTAELLAEMAATPDIGGGSLLDNTLVVYWSEVSDGAAHGVVDMPVLLFGGKFLKLKGGSFLQLGNASANAPFSPGGQYAKGPAPYTSDLWVTTAQAFGLSSMTAFGDPMWNTGRISGVFG